MSTERRRSATTGVTYPWVVDGSAMVNHYYLYCVDEDVGPFFLKFCSYFPYNAKLCINGNEYAKCQLRKRGIAFEALDNGVLSCADPKGLQRICDGLDDRKIDRLLRKWLARLPHPFDRRDRMAGYRCQASILQAEFALTQVLDLFAMPREPRRWPPLLGPRRRRTNGRCVRERASSACTRCAASMRARLAAGSAQRLRPKGIRPSGV